MYTKKVLALVLAVVLIFALAVPIAGAAGLSISDIAAKYETYAYMSTDTEYLFANIIDAATFATVDALPEADLKADLAAAGYSEKAVKVTFDAAFAASYDLSVLGAKEYGYLTSDYGFYAIAVVKGAAAPAEPAPAPAIEVEPAPMPVVDVVEETAVVTKQSLTINGDPVSVVAAYNIKGNNYFKLRDVAVLITTFNAAYNDTLKAIELTSKTAYVPDGSESKAAPTADAKATISNNAVYLDGADISDKLTVYKIDGSNYFKLRDFEDVLSLFDVEYDDATKTMQIIADGAPKPAAPEAPAEPAKEEPAKEAPAAPAAKTAADIVAGLTASEAGVGAGTKAFSFDTLANAQPTIDALKAIGYTEDASGQGETTTQKANTYSTFDLSMFGVAGYTLYVYVA
jgi:hypothetical protein